MVLSFKQVSDGSSGLRGWSQQQQQIGAGLEIPPPTSQASSNQQQQQRREKSIPLKCPRCDSTNTKFCYYNNYSLRQPRHFCRTCKRHWTEGGTLRNVPVGGGRKARRPRTSNATAVGVSKNKSTMSSAMFPDILRQLLLQTPPPPPPSEHSYSNNSSSGGGLLGSQLPPYQFLPVFHGTQPGIVSSFDGASSAGPPSLSSASGGNDSGINLMDGTSTANTWPWEPAALPDNYWSCWDGMEDFAAPSSSH